jgi:hypothetical protein
MKDKAFSSNQLFMSVVPIKELAHTKVNTTVNIITQGFLINGTRFLEMAIVKLINYLVSNLTC